MSNPNSQSLAEPEHVSMVDMPPQNESIGAGGMCCCHCVTDPKTGQFNISCQMPKLCLGCGYCLKGYGSIVLCPVISLGIFLNETLTGCSQRVQNGCIGWTRWTRSGGCCADIKTGRITCCGQKGCFGGNEEYCGCQNGCCCWCCCIREC